ncbi:MAG TPA: tRNA (adenine-N1)-methyltransferase [Actinomycetota bacterium]|nr:tRNA (adenine-N1)-methyltransferase [Actinomycetota bacterium]
MSAPLEAGERILLVDRKGRRYLLALKAGGEFHAHHGVVAHDEIIGKPEGIKVTSTGGATMIAYRPGIADFILKMPRGAQVIYPKDIGPILIEADVYPGATVLEAGTGSGALTLALVRAVGEQGRVVSYDLREDHSAKARTNLESFLGKLPDSLELRIGDVISYEGEPADRVVLDLPEPWRAVAVAQRLLRRGGIMCCYVPSITQIALTVESMREAGFEEIRPFETMVRPWHVEGASVRPEHRMVGHTGFLVTGRLLGLA